jgi:hypothetical protein
LKGSIGVLLLFVHDFPNMLAFYCDKLGLPVSSIHPGKRYEPLVDWTRLELEGLKALQ